MRYPLTLIPVSIQDNGTSSKHVTNQKVMVIKKQFPLQRKSSEDGMKMFTYFIQRSPTSWVSF